MKKNKNGTWTLTDDEMNFVSLYMDEAHLSFVRRKRLALADDAYEKSVFIYNQLKKSGYYDNCK